jgi:hypothetical protein
MSEPAGGQTTPATQTEIDPMLLQMAMDRLRTEQSLGGAIVGGAVAALAGAAAWAGITVATSFQIGWMAVGVGFLVGFAVRSLGKGLDKTYGIVGAAWSLVGCGVGNLLAVVGLVSQQENIPFFALLSSLNFDIAKEMMVATFSPMDLLFYGIAVYEGYRFAFRRLTQEQLSRYLNPAAPIG